jgi:hypothetical protein
MRLVLEVFTNPVQSCPFLEQFHGGVTRSDDARNLLPFSLDNAWRHFLGTNWGVSSTLYTQYDV